MKYRLHLFIRSPHREHYACWLRSHFPDYIILCDNTEVPEPVSLPINKEIFSPGKEARFLANEDQDILLCDRAGILSAAASSNLPFLAVSHRDNREERLTGAPWMIESPEALTPDFLREVLCRHYHVPLEVCQTNRCILRELVMEDLPVLIQLQLENADKPDASFFPAEVFPDRAADFLAAYIKNRYPFYRYGIYGILLKPLSKGNPFSGDRTLSKCRPLSGNRTLSRCRPLSGDRTLSEDRPLWQDRSSPLIGIAGFSESQTGSRQETEVGYSVLKAFQNRGIASEILPPLIRYGKEEHGLSEILVVTRRDNTAAIRLAKKNGLPLILV